MLTEERDQHCILGGKEYETQHVYVHKYFLKKGKGKTGWEMLLFSLVVQ